MNLIGKTMRAVLADGSGGTLLETVPVPDPEPGWALVRVECCGVCSTDLELVAGSIDAPFPIVPGHEWSGVVVAVGAEEDAGWISRRVAGENEVSCMRCEACLAGRVRLCSSYEQIGFSARSGGYAELLSAPVAGLHELPSHVSFTQGALLEPLAVAMALVARARVRLASTLTVIGDGPLGLQVVACARAAGARRIVLSGEHSERLAMGVSFGAREAVDHRRTPLREVVAGLHGHSDAVIETSGSPGGFDDALACVAPEGRIVLGGYFASRRVTWSPDLVHLGNICLEGAGNLPGWMGTALSAVCDGLVASERLVTHRYRLDQHREALVAARERPAGFVKAVFAPAPR